MNRATYVAQVLQELGESMGMPDLALNDQGWILLRMNEVPVRITYSPNPLESISISADLGEVERDSREQMQGLLQLGLVTWSHNCMTIGLTDNGRRAVGTTLIPVSQLSRDLLEQTLVALQQAAEMVRDRLTHGDFQLLEPGDAEKIASL